MSRIKVTNTEISDITLGSGGIRTSTTQAGAGSHTGGYVAINNPEITLDAEL